MRRPVPRPIADEAPSSSSAHHNSTGSSHAAAYASVPTAFHPHDATDPSHHDPHDDPATPNGSSTSSSASSLHRHLTLTDLIAIGIGGTIGSGLFVLAGLVAHRYAGPATAVSWCVAGTAALLSGCCYAELAARIPLAGGAYAYTYTALGEYPAVLTATCLSMDYVCAAAAGT